MQNIPSILPKWEEVRATWQEFVAVFRIYNRRAELKQLLIWARRKRLTRPKHLYQNRLLDEEQRLAFYTLRSANIVVFAYLLHMFVTLFFPRPRHYRKGSAAKYRRPST